jgi:hypothetical protein
LAVYIFIIARGLYIAVQAQDTYGRLLAGSLVCTFFVYAFVNIGMVIGVLPVVGIPNKPRQPNKPNSSAKTAKIKSVELSGKKSNCDWVFPCQPLP